MDWRDRPVSVRPGEEPDSDALCAYLEKNFPDFEPPLRIQQYPSGFSNLTYQLAWGSSTCILRRPPIGANVKSGHDMHREYRILNGLSKRFNKVPSPLAYCEDETILGAPFYIMERLEGIILRTGSPQAMLPDADTMHNIAKSFVLTLAELHDLDYARAGLEDLGKPEGYIARQINGWNKRYLSAKTDNIPLMVQVGEWLHGNQPGEVKGSLIHNDFKYDNLVLDSNDSTKIKGILDWEMATLGDPLMDLGTTLGYWVEPDDPPFMHALKLSPTTLPGNPTRMQLAAWYSEASGLSLENIVFYYVYGLFKIAVIVQQIYHRYTLGHTQDDRFADLIHAVTAFSEMATRVIQLNRIDRLYS